jgi:hypothetical protein
MAGCIQVVIDVNEGVWPQTLLQLLPRNYGAGLLQQNRQRLERLAGQFQSQSSLAQFPVPEGPLQTWQSELPGWCRPGLASLGCLKWQESNTEARMHDEDV